MGLPNSRLGVPTAERRSVSFPGGLKLSALVNGARESRDIPSRAFSPSVDGGVFVSGRDRCYVADVTCLRRDTHPGWRWIPCGRAR